jgi:hypothetical protein
LVCSWWSSWKQCLHNSFCQPILWIRSELGSGSTQVAVSMLAFTHGYYNHVQTMWKTSFYSLDFCDITKVTITIHYQTLD